MSLEQFLNYLIAHNTKIIEVLLGLTLLAILYLSIRMFLFVKEPTGAPGAADLDLSGIEKTLKELIEKAGQVPTAAAAADAGTSQDTQRLLTEISNLKIELEAKQKQIEDISFSPAGAASGVASDALSDDAKAKLETQIQELQAKLSEYEIISEDIADLSFYKEQNTKLQKEIQTLKSGGAATTSPAAAPAPPATPAAKMEPPEMISSSSSAEITDAQSMADDIFAAAAATSSSPATPSPAKAASAASTSPIDDDLMAEFAAAVEGQKSGTLTNSNASAPAPAVEAPTESGVDLGQMNMDKMMDEAANIKSDAVEDIDPEKALGTSLDENKLLQEAAALEGGSESGVTDEDKLLMSEFENFVKKNESS